MGYIGDNEVDRMAPLRSSAVVQSYHLTYDRGSAQSLTIDCGDWRRQFFLLLPPSCSDRFQAKPIRYGLGDEVVGGAQIDKRRVGVIALAARALA
jgi:hypothetical protein